MKILPGQEYTLYMHINKINGKKYIGVTSMKTYKRWGGGSGYSKGSYIGKAIRKYGWNNFHHVIMRENLYFEQARLLEVEYIRRYNLRDSRFGYNLSKGGECGAKGVVVSRETRQKMSESRKGVNNGMYGKRHSEESKRKMGINKGTPVYCIELNKEFYSAKEAGRQMQVDYACITRACRGIYKTAAGYHWEFVNINHKEAI